MSDWTDQIVGARMAVDREFNDRLAASEFSSQEWGMIMTAVEFEIDHPDRPEDASVIANTENVGQVMGAVDDVRSQMGAMGGAPTDQSPKSSGGGFLDSIKGALGLDDGGGSDERLEAATALADEYASQLETHLKEKGKWDRACRAAAGQNGAAAGTGDDSGIDGGDDFEGGDDSNGDRPMDSDDGGSTIDSDDGGSTIDGSERDEKDPDQATGVSERNEDSTDQGTGDDSVSDDDSS